MILFFKQDAQQFTAEKLILESSYPDEIKFADTICGREEVIIVDSMAKALEAGQSKPTARIILLSDNKYGIHVDDILDMGKKGISQFANRGDVDELVEKVAEAYGEKKNLSSYILQEEPQIREINNDKVQLKDLINKHIVGKSPEIIRMLQDIEAFCRFDEDILIRGEHGAGKEVVAKTLIDNLPRKSKGIGIMNVGAIAPQLFASELFGYMKGAFTGADKNREGMLSKYREGIVYLDEIGELPYDVQASLLRVLQDREFTPLGSNETLEFKGQIIMATNRPIERLIAEKKFHEDLYFRMEKMVIHTPPLRLRKGDISLLTAQFLASYNNRYKHDQRNISSEGVSLLSELDWPGNVRELQNFVFKAIVAEKSSMITLETVVKVIKSVAPMEISPAKSNLESLKALGEKFNLREQHLLVDGNVGKAHGLKI